VIDVTIVIPAYNAEAYLAQAIESVIAQTYQHWQLVVLDDGSRDSTFLIAERYARHDARIQAHTQANSGVAATRNNGFRLAGAETGFVLFLDNDDYLESDAVKVLRSTLLSSPDSVAAYGFPRDVDAGGAPISTALSEAYGFKRPTLSHTRKLAAMAVDAPDQFTNLVVWPSILTPGQVLIRASALAQVEPFDSTTAPSDDWDMWIRLSLHGPFRRVLQYTLNKRSHAANVSKQGKVMAVAEPQIRGKLASSRTLTPAQKELARLGHRYACVYKLSWAKYDLRRKNVAGAARTLYRALQSYRVYLRTNYRV
jgi:glycosyltransferase involved in cell wall biosynthesis